MNRNFLEKDIKLSIVILTYNRKDKVSRCIDSCLESNINCKYEIIVIDNHSTDGTKELIESNYLQDIKYNYMQDNLGAPQGRNEGFMRAKGEFILFLDDDIYFKGPDDIRKLLEVKISNDKIAIITTKIFDVIENRLMVEIESKQKRKGKLINVLSFHGAIHIIKKADYKNVLYSSKVKFGYEELMLSMSTFNRGFRVACYNKITVMHDHPRFFQERKFIALNSLLYTKKAVYPKIFYPIIKFMHYLRCFKHFGFNLKQIKDVTNIDIKIDPKDKIAFKTVFKLLKEYPFAKIF
ncbi:MAG: glycosyltransferase family 2 protein [Clostridiaceae bacterium]